MLTSLVAMILKELRQTVRDRRSLTVLMVAPMLQLIVFGYAVNLDVSHVKTLTVDQDHTTRSRQFLSDLTAGETFDYAGSADTAREAMDQLTEGEVELAVVIPPGFAERISRGKTGHVQLLVDGADSNRATVAEGAAEVYATLRSISLLRRRLATAALRLGIVAAVGTVRVEPRIYYNASLNSQLFFVPGVAATVLLIVVMIVTALGIAREKESGTLEQVMVTPIRPVVIVLGKTLPYAFIGLIDLGAVLAVGSLLFGVPFRGNLLLVFGGGALYVTNLVGIGTFLGTLARNQQQALIGAMFFVLPGMLLSGFVSPIDNMPTWLQPWTVLNPVRHFIEILRSVLLKDAHGYELLPQYVIMAGMGLAIYVLAASLLRRSMT